VVHVATDAEREVDALRFETLDLAAKDVERRLIVW